MDPVLGLHCLVSFRLFIAVLRCAPTLRHRAANVCPRPDNCHVNNATPHLSRVRLTATIHGSTITPSVMEAT